MDGLVSSAQEDVGPVPLQQFANLFSTNVLLEEEYHREEYISSGYEDLPINDDSWRLKGRMKTSGVALVVCLNIGIDPPDVKKPNPAARKECWFDPTGQKQKGLEFIGNALQQQYEKWQAKAKFKQCLDPTCEELRKTCINLRKSCRSDRLLFHYNGHGVPKPTKNGELWTFGKHYTHYTPVAICEMRSWLGDPTMYVLDCSAAGMLIPHLVDSAALKDSETAFESAHNASTLSFVSSQNSLDSSPLVLAACKANEQLPFHPMFPADIFTSCLTTPTTIAIRWFILQNPQSMRDVNPDIAETIPGKDNDRKSPRGELNWILTAITDTIAWNTLPPRMFKRMFRHDLLVASLFRNFLISKRLMKSLNCTPQSWPPLPDSTTHPLWQAWDMALESFLTQQVSLQRGSSMVDRRNNMPFNMPSNLSFFNDQLSAFEMWLQFGTCAMPPPLQLPVLLQVLLSQSHRLRALQLLKRYLSLGLEAVRVALILGIYPYIVKLLQNQAEETKHILIAIWAAIIGFDPSCRQELIREKSQIYFLQGMISPTSTPAQRCLATFVLAEICNGSKEGQQSCLLLGLHRQCETLLRQAEIQPHNSLKLWVCLCLFKLCEDCVSARYICLTESCHTSVYPLLADLDPIIRTAAALALGELFGASARTSSVLQTNPSSANLRHRIGSANNLVLSSTSDDASNPRVTLTVNHVVEEKDLYEAELQLALQILDCCSDGSVMVRLEAVYALSKFFVQPTHIDCIKIVAKAVFERNQEKKMKSDQKSTSPSIDNANAATGFGKTPHFYPWHLSPAESRVITEQVEAFIESRNELLQTLVLNEHGGSGSLVSAAREDKEGQTPPLPTLMASTYVRLWLALTEVEGKDPHAVVAQAAATIRFRVHALIAIDERNASRSSSSLDAPGRKPSDLPSGSQSLSWSQHSYHSLSNLPLPTQFEQRMRRAFAPVDSHSGLLPNDSDAAVPQLSPFSGLSTPTRAKIIKFGAKIPRSSSFLSTPDIAATDEGVSQSVGGHSPATTLVAATMAAGNQAVSKNYFVECFKEYAHLTEEDLMICFSSNHYEMAKKRLLQPAAPTEPWTVDPLSEEGHSSEYRAQRLKEIIENQQSLAELFRDIDDRTSGMLMSMGPEEHASFSASMGSATTPSFPSHPASKPSGTVGGVGIALPASNIVKFEQKSTMNMDSQMTTSLAMFHAFQDLLVVAHGSSANIWSTNSNCRLVEVRNKHSMRLSSGGSSRQSQRGFPFSMNSDHASGSSSRITSMTWINESYDALLLLGSDDGVVRIWRDVSTLPDAVTANDRGSPSIVASPAALLASSTVELATAFIALPDIAETSRGSGIVLSWQQSAGSLVVGGNSSTIRVWDLAHEQIERVFYTGVDTCLTAMATSAVFTGPSQSLLSNFSISASYGTRSQLTESQPMTWTFAGFANGSVCIYDERVNANNGRVHFSHTHSTWISHAHLRADVPEVVIGSVRGTVKFWDVRTMRTYKTLEVQKSPLTALAVHKCAPIMATGSHAQFIKILTLGGEQIGNIIKYYDGFLGQRIGPVSCLAFHPHRLLLAATSTDGIISLYGAA